MDDDWRTPTYSAYFRSLLCVVQSFQEESVLNAKVKERNIEKTASAPNHIFSLVFRACILMC